MMGTSWCCPPKVALAALIAVGCIATLADEAGAVACDPPGAAEMAATTTIIPTLTSVFSADITAQTELLIPALQGLAAQVSANIRGSITGMGEIIEGLSNHQAQRAVQSDRVAADIAHQFSTTLCAASTGASIGLAQGLLAQPTGILRAKANANRTAGLPTPGAVPVAATPQATLNDRQSLYCDAKDPACKGSAGSRPNADRMAWSILSMTRLDSADDKTQATWIINNLAGPVPAPALTARDLAQNGGVEKYVRRGGYETAINYARDVLTDILYTRREETADATYYNALAQNAGVKPITAASQEDMDQMRYVLRFSPKYSTSLAGLSGDALQREQAVLATDALQQGYRTQKLLEQSIIADAAIMAAMYEGKLASAAGSVQ